jgi:hypothetical protein
MFDSYFGVFVIFAVIIVSMVAMCESRHSNCTDICALNGDKSMYTWSEGCLCIEKLPGKGSRTWNPRPAYGSGRKSEGQGK